MCTLKSVLSVATVCSLLCRQVFIPPGGLGGLTKAESMLLWRRLVSLLAGGCSNDEERQGCAVSSPSDCPVEVSDLGSAQSESGKWALT